MDIKNKNLLNLFNKVKLNNESVSLLVLALLPAIFVTKTIEAVLIYLVIYFIYLVLSTLVGKLVNKLLDNNNAWIATLIANISIATLLSIVFSSILINFGNEFNIYLYFMTLSSLPYMINEDTKEENVGKSLLNALQSFLGFALLMFIVALLREVLGTGMITFGNYTNLSFSLKLFPKYAMTIFANNFGSLVILGIVLGVFNLTLQKRGETK